MVFRSPLDRASIIFELSHAKPTDSQPDKWILEQFLVLHQLISRANAIRRESFQAVKFRADHFEQVSKLLALKPGATLAAISTWADEDRNRTTAARHYINLRRGNCTYNAQRDCPNGNCVVEAINRQLAVLASDASDEKRLTALKKIVHFVADVHQPLHEGYADDRGGNTYQLQAFGRGTNLHGLWDSGLVENMGLTAKGLSGKLKVEDQGDVSLDMARAAEEPCKIVGTTGFYPAGKLGVDYVAQFTPILENRLATAGARLARMLNPILN